MNKGKSYGALVLKYHVAMLQKSSKNHVCSTPKVKCSHKNSVEKFVFDAEIKKNRSVTVST